MKVIRKTVFGSLSGVRWVLFMKEKSCTKSRATASLMKLSKLTTNANFYCYSFCRGLSWHKKRARLRNTYKTTVCKKKNLWYKWDLAHLQMGILGKGLWNEIREKSVQSLLVWSFLQSWARNNFIASRQRIRDNVTEPEGPEKNLKIFMPRCLDGVATPNIVILHKLTTLWPENVVTLSRQYCRVPSSALLGWSI